MTLTVVPIVLPTVTGDSVVNLPMLIDTDLPGETLRAAQMMTWAEAVRATVAARTNLSAAAPAPPEGPDDVAAFMASYGLGHAANHRPATHSVVSSANHRDAEGGFVGPAARPGVPDLASAQFAASRSRSTPAQVSYCSAAAAGGGEMTPSDFSSADFSSAVSVNFSDTDPAPLEAAAMAGVMSSYGVAYAAVGYRR